MSTNAPHQTCSGGRSSRSAAGPCSKAGSVQQQGHTLALARTYAGDFCIPVPSIIGSHTHSCWLSYLGVPWGGDDDGAASTRAQLPADDKHRHRGVLVGNDTNVKGNLHAAAQTALSTVMRKYTHTHVSTHTVSKQTKMHTHWHTDTHHALRLNAGSLNVCHHHRSLLLPPALSAHAHPQTHNVIKNKHYDIHKKETTGTVLVGAAQSKDTAEPALTGSRVRARRTGCLPV